jgi:hypothetical protein
VVVSHGRPCASPPPACAGASSPFVLANHLPNLGTVTLEVELHELVVRDWNGRTL